MATVAERAPEVYSKILDLPLDASFSRRVELRKELIELIEQALLAERRLAMEEAAKIVERRTPHPRYENCSECELLRDATIDIRAAAEKEV